jgi:hypothetical protein
VGPSAGLDAVEKRKMLHCRESNPGRAARRYTDSSVMDMYQNAIRQTQVCAINKIKLHTDKTETQINETYLSCGKQSVEQWSVCMWVAVLSDKHS